MPSHMSSRYAALCKYLITECINLISSDHKTVSLLGKAHRRKHGIMVHALHLVVKLSSLAKQLLTHVTLLSDLASLNLNLLMCKRQRKICSSQNNCELKCYYYQRPGKAFS